MAKAKCCICGKPLAIIAVNKVRLQGGQFVCFNCVKKAGHDPFRWMGNLYTTPDQIMRDIKDNERKMDEARQTQSQQQIPDPAEEIMKYKKLYDAGALTEEEFTAKKKQLLGI